MMKILIKYVNAMPYIEDWTDKEVDDILEINIVELIYLEKYI